MHTSQEKPGLSLHKEQHDTAKDCKISRYPGITGMELTNIPASVFKENVYLLYSTYRNCDVPRLLYEMCQKSEAFCAIVAATQLYVANSSDPGLDFETYYSRGLSLFRKQLDMYTGSLDASVLTTGLFICTLNVGSFFNSLPLLLAELEPDFSALPRSALVVFAGAHGECI
jgi:hypothetical protein